MIKTLLLTFSFITSLFIGTIAPLVSADAASALITEVQTGYIDANTGLEYPKQEFVEVANVSSAKLPMDGWRLEYLSAAHTGEGAPTATLVTIQGTLPINGQALFSYVGYNPSPSDLVFGEGSTASSGMLAKSGGHIRLMNGNTMIDCVAWGSATAITGCDKISSVPAAGQTIQRPHSENGSYEKSLGVKALSPPTPQGGELYPSWETPVIPGSPNEPGTDPADPEAPEEPTEPTDPTEPTEPEPARCSTIELSEVLPNPAGSDTDSEYIELHNNSSQAASLFGCTLRIGSAGKTYVFPAESQLAAHEYRAFYYAATGLQLTNSGGEVWLLGEEVQTSLTYPTSGDDQAWAFIEGSWQTTFYPTPHAVNSLGPKTDSPEDVIAAALESCPVGKYRNPETNRCKNIEAADSGPTACDPGQERNPETNRCRKIPVAATVTACPEGQERNPSTNRCRKIASASTPTPCAEGQERNPETNRCRKVTAAPTKSNTDTPKSNGIQNYRILIAVLILIVGYAVYEYRQDILGQLNKLRATLLRKKEP